eukprot:scaffold231388_cov36-Prasinocladus_malaysianus.AAC.1
MSNGAGCHAMVSILKRENLHFFQPFIESYVVGGAPEENGRQRDEHPGRPLFGTREHEQVLADMDADASAEESDDGGVLFMRCTAASSRAAE